MIYLIADTHFCHTNIIKYENRPFADADEMDNHMIKQWNSVVNKDDVVYHLGDVFLCPTTRQFEIMNQLNGDIILIRGNHDSQSRTKLIDRLGFEEVYDVGIQELGFTLTHYPINPNMLINIHGHSHSKRENDILHYCVSVEMVDYTPISIEQIKEDIWKN